MIIERPEGTYTKYELIDSIIGDLNRLVLSGVDNWVITINSIQKLSSLKEGLRKEDASRADNHDK